MPHEQFTSQHGALLRITYEPVVFSLLDAHIFGNTEGKALLEGGHDMRAPDSEPELEALSDPEVLQLAAEGRVLVTAHIRDFEPLLRQWVDEGRPHAGVILVPSSVGNEAFSVLISGVEKTIANIDQEQWVDRVVWLRKA